MSLSMLSAVGVLLAAAADHGNDTTLPVTVCGASCINLTCADVRHVLTCAKSAGLGCDCSGCCDAFPQPPECDELCGVSTCGDLRAEYTCAETSMVGCQCGGCCDESVDPYASLGPGAEVMREVHGLARLVRENPLDALIFVLLPFLLRIVGDELMKLISNVIKFVFCCRWGGRSSAQRMANESPGGTMTPQATANHSRGATGESHVTADEAHSTNWQQALDKTGLGFAEALAWAGIKLLLWHLLQPFVFLVVAMATWPGLGRGQRVGVVILGIREVIYAIATVLLVAGRPSFLLVDTIASIDSDPYHAMLYVFAPDVTIARTLGGVSELQNGAGLLEFLIKLLLAPASLVVLIIGIVTSYPTPLLAACITPAVGGFLTLLSLGH